MSAGEPGNGEHCGEGEECGPGGGVVTPEGYAQAVADDCECGAYAGVQ